MKIKVRSKNEITAPPKFDKTHKPKIKRESSTNDSFKNDPNLKSHSSIFYLLWFVVLVGIFIMVALAARIIFLFQKSTFTTNSFAIYEQTADPQILVYEKDTPRLTMLKIPQGYDEKLKLSLKYGVPIDSEVKHNGAEDLSFGEILNIIFKPWDFTYKNMTALDHIKFIWGSMGIKSDQVKIFSITLDKDNEIKGATSEDIYDAFKDPEIINEALSISVTNETDMEGLAGSVAEIIRNAGGNVVSVSSEDRKAGKSFIKSKHESRTLSRISNLLEIKPQIDKNMSGISDIKIILGDDFKNRIY